MAGGSYIGTAHLPAGSVVHVWRPRLSYVRNRERNKSSRAGLCSDQKPCWGLAPRSGLLVLLPPSFRTKLFSLTRENNGMCVSVMGQLARIATRVQISN